MPRFSYDKKYDIAQQRGRDIEKELKWSKKKYNTNNNINLISKYKRK